MTTMESQGMTVTECLQHFTDKYLQPGEAWVETTSQQGTLAGP